MASIGPTLPPHLLAKRKRDDEDSDGDSSETSSKSTSSASKKRRTVPAMPPVDNKWKNRLNEENDQASDEPNPALDAISVPTARKPVRTLGPAMPPANVLERPSTPAGNNEDSDDDDDGIGPALPGSVSAVNQTNNQDSAVDSTIKPAQVKVGRDDWMLAPPTSGNRAGTIDPSKMKNRGFSSGPRAAPQSGGDMSLWTETPEEKRKRLEEEMLGIRRTDQPKSNDAEQVRAEAKAAELAKKVQAYNEKNRAAPLYTTKERETDEDDPSKRAFDREKDIGGGKLSHTETKQMLNKAADFGSRFSKGSYL